MALSFYSNTDSSISFEDFINSLEERIIFSDEESLLSCTDLLFKMCNNSDFLCDFINKGLTENLETFQTGNAYSEQSVMLYDSDKFFIRATYWPKLLKNLRVRSAHSDLFSYGLIHDHNFPLLTGGYTGSGYKTKLWEYNHDDVIGYSGEKVEITFLEETALHPGKVLYYRPSKDIHCQLPPEEEDSIAINIILKTRQHLTKKQFEFDIEKGQIKRVLDGTLAHLINFIKLSTVINTEKTKDLLMNIAKNNQIPKIRLEAISSLNEIENTQSFWKMGIEDKDDVVSKFSKFKYENLQVR